MIKNYIDHRSPGPIRFPVLNMWPNEAIYSDVDYTKEYAELQLIVPGKFGIVERFNGSLVPVLSTPDTDYTSMCLSLKIDEQSSSTQLVIDECTSPGYYSVMSRKSDMIQPYACKEGYYRYIQTIIPSIEECFSIKKLTPEVLVTNRSGLQAVISSNEYCNGSMMDLMSNDHYLMFMHLSQLMSLNDSDRCLFQLQSNDVISYSEWDTLLVHPIIDFVNWDPLMDHETILNNQHSILTINSAGQWTWANDSITCIVCMDSVAILNPSLHMNFNLMDRRLEVDVTNQDFLFRYADEYVGFQCYALIDYVSGNDVSYAYKTELKIIASHRSTSEYFVENVGVGIYWCAGQKIYDTKNQIRTETIFAYIPVFVLRVEQKCPVKCDADDLMPHLLRIYSLFSCTYPSNIISCGAGIIYHDANSTSVHATFTVRLSITLPIEPIGDSIKSLTMYQIYTFRAYERLLRLPYNASREINVISVRSVDLCLHDSMSSLELVVWGIGQIGESFSPPICNFQANVSLPNRICSGNEETGAMWREQFPCYSPVSPILFELFASFNDTCQISDVIANITTTLDNFDGTLFPVDVFVVSRIVEKIATILKSDQTSLNLTELRQIFHIFNILSATDNDFLAISSNLNATNVMLESLDELLLGNMQYPIDVSTDGIASIETPLLLSYLTDPVLTGISGVALFSSQANWDDDFTDTWIRYIYHNETLLDLINDDRFVIGAKLPDEILATHSKISFTIFSNDHLFHSNPNERNFRVNGKIISISLCCSLTPFPTGSVTQIFLKLSHNTTKSNCTYWDLMSINGWSTDGCQFGEYFDVNGGRIMLCNCSHLTHFGNILHKDDIPHDVHHAILLNLITLIGCTLSSIGVLGIYATAIVFSKWCETSSAKIVLHFATSILLQMVLMLTIDIDENFRSKLIGNRNGCVLVAVGLHYSILANFFWMLIISNFQFQRYVIVFNKYHVKRVILKSAMIGWGCPVIPIAVVLFYDSALYIPTDQNHFCYPTGHAFYYGLVLPLGLIILCNGVVFLSVLFSIFKGTKSPQAGSRMNADLRWSKLRLLAFLFFVLGMTWIFGFLSGIGKQKSLLFTYVFCIFATIQGFVLFAYCIVLDAGTRRLWTNSIRKCLRKKF